MAVYSTLANPYTSQLPTYPDLGESDRIYQLINKMPRVENYILVKHENLQGGAIQVEELYYNFASG